MGGVLMAANINRVVISGNVTRDPELRQTASGMAVLSFGVAVNDRRRNSQTGQWEDYANFIDVTMFGERAQSLGGIICKGMKLAIEGKLRWSQWEARDGSGKRSKVEVIAESVELPPKSAQSAPMQQQAYGYTQQQQTAPYSAPQQPQTAQMQPAYGQQEYGQQQMQPPAQQSVYDEEIPF